MSFHDLAVHNAYNPKSDQLALAKSPNASVVLARLCSIRPAERTITLEVSWHELTASKMQNNSPEALNGLPMNDARRQFVMQPRFCDINTERIIDQMERDASQHTSGEASLAGALLCDTRTFARRQPTPLLTPPPSGEQRNGIELREFYEARTMTVSQQKTYDHICSHALSIVWGPPGSGKTLSDGGNLPHARGGDGGRLPDARARDGVHEQRA